MTTYAYIPASTLELIRNGMGAGDTIVLVAQEPRKRATVAPETVERIKVLRDSGMTLRAIADTLNDEGIPTLHGKPWKYGTIAWFLSRQEST